jgi:isopenicillin N synthase-like dioxygenase
MAAGEILEVDLVRYEQGGEAARRAVVEGVMASLATGFVYLRSDLSEDLLDEAYGLLGRFFAEPEATKRRFHVSGASGQTGYTGVLVETAAGRQRADWKEMLNWSAPPARDHPLRRRYPHLYPEPLLPETVVPGITAVLGRFHRSVLELQRRFLRVIAVGLGCAETFFEEMTADGPTLSRAVRYPPMQQAPAGGHVWAAAHADINLITALPRATAAGLQVRLNGSWVAATPPPGRVILNGGLMLERLSNGRIPAAWHRVVAAPESRDERLSVVQFCHPRPWTLLAPLPCCITPERPQRWAGVMAGDALAEVLHGIRMLESGPAPGEAGGS